MNYREEVPMTTNKMRPCRKCHGKATMLSAMNRYYIKCSKCGASTGLKKSKDEALFVWNEPVPKNFGQTPYRHIHKKEIDINECD